MNVGKRVRCSTQKYLDVFGFGEMWGVRRGKVGWGEGESEEVAHLDHRKAAFAEGFADVIEAFDVRCHKRKHWLC